MLIRGLYYVGWHMRDKAPAERTKSVFLGHIEAAFKQDPNAHTEALVREVFKLLTHKLSSGQITDVKHVLPPEVRALWPLEPGEEASAVASRPQGGRNFEL